MKNLIFVLLFVIGSIANAQAYFKGGNLIVSPTGKAGIGTTSPQVILDIQGTTTLTSSILLPRGTTANRHAGVNGMVRYNTNTSVFEGYANGYWADLLRLTSGSQYPAADGNLISNINAVKIQGVDIASTSPTNAYVLTFNSTGSKWEPRAAAGGSAGGSNTQVQFNNSSAFGGSSNFTWDNTNGLLTITGISSSNTDYAMIINGSTTTGGGRGFKINAGGSGNGSVVTLDATTNSGGGRVFDFFSSGSGNGAIGGGKWAVKDTAANLYALVVGDGSGGARIQFGGYGAGTLSTDASGIITATSDERLKNILGNFTASLEALKKIKPILYKWNSLSGLDPEHVYAGFSAQNIQKSIPEAVGQMNSGYLTIQDRAILAATINAINELDARLSKIEQKLK